VPAAAQREIDAERQRAGQALIKAAGYAYLAFTPVAVGSWVVGLAGGWPLAGVATLLMALAALCLWFGRRPRPVPPGLFAVALALHGAMLGLAGVLLGPLLIIPTVAVGSHSTFQLMPTVRYPRTTLVVHLLAVIAPLGLELLGALPSTFTLNAGGLSLHPWAFHATPASLVAGAVVAFVLQLTVDVTVISRLRARQDHELARRHVQAWKLRQLVPGAGA
jgi:hypothetical protein